MKKYFFPASIPELAHLPSDDAKLIYRKYFYKSFFHWGQWLALGTFIIAMLVGEYVVKVLIMPFVDIGLQEKWDSAFVMIFVLVGVLSWSVIGTETIRYMIRKDIERKK